MWRWLFLALVSGVLLGQSFISQGFHFLIFMAFVPLIWMEHELSQSKRKRQGFKVFLLSYVSFFLWNGISYWWLHFARRFSDFSYAWEAFVLPVLLNSLFMAIAFWSYHKVKKISGNGYGLFYLPVVWICFEKLHLSWEITFPWLNLGNVFAWNYKWVQWYEYLGSFGGTTWIFTINLLIFYQLTAFKNTREKKFLWRLGIGGSLLVFVPILLSLFLYKTHKERGDSVKVTVIQPELDPYQEKYDLSSQEIVSELLGLMRESIETGSQYFVVPETAFPGSGSINIDAIDKDPYVAQFKRFTDSTKTHFIGGVELYKLGETRDELSESAIFLKNQKVWLERYNSTLAISKGKIDGLYHKSKLVPGVESFPYKWLLEPILGSLLMDFGGTVSSVVTQEERSVFHFPEDKLTIAPAICYESIYGEFVTEYVKKGANAIFIMTNDSWWGTSDGHRQLLAFGRLRAIENRRAIARSANSGISCFVNQRGDIVSQKPYGIQATLTDEIQLNNEFTFYTKYGDVIARIALLLWGVLVAYTFSSLLMGDKKKK